MVTEASGAVVVLVGDRSRRAKRPVEASRAGEYRRMCVVAQGWVPEATRRTKVDEASVAEVLQQRGPGDGYDSEKDGQQH